MVFDNRELIDTPNNVDWLNAIRNELGYDYQSRIPEATQANVQDVVQRLWTYKPQMNQFIDALVNRIGLVIFQEWSWANPLAPLKRGMLNWGETIEEIMVGLIEADEYDADRDELEKELFGAKVPEVQASYHTVNRKNRYKLTVKEPLLRNAFLTDNGLSDFVGQLLGAAQKSDQFDEYLLMANLFKEMDQAADGLFNAKIADIGDEGSTPEQNRYALRRIREFGVTLQFPSRAYNMAGMHQAINPDDLILFTTPEANAAMDVEALAAAFNIDKAEVNNRKFVLPQEHYGIPGFQAAVTTKEFFVVADQRIDTTSLYNPSALFTNYWLHHWQVISASRFAPLVMFNSLRESTVLNRPEYVVTDITAFTITDEDGVTQATNVERGKLYNVGVEAVTTPAGGPMTAVRYAVEGATSIFTRVTNNGVLAIGIDETATNITIRATAVDSHDVPQYTETTTRAVVGEFIRPWPHPEASPDADNDGLKEATPDQLEMVDNKVTIPTVVGVQYRKAGVNVANGSVNDITVADTAFDAVARTGYELTAGAWTWSFSPA
jgi:hypothetical protein